MASRNNCVKPYIGITCDQDKETDRLQLRMAYCRSILNAGGLPVLIPYVGNEDMTAILAHVDGLHQAIKSASYPFRTVAKAEDGIIEAIESNEHKFCLGVQWHPERMPDDFVSRCIFAAFIDACYEKVREERLNHA